MITVTYHIPNDTPHVEYWNEEPTRAREEAKCLETGALHYSVQEVSDGDDTPVVLGRVDGGVPVRGLVGESGAGVSGELR